MGIEAFRRAKMKFPGRQNIYESKNWGFTKFKKMDYVQMRREGRFIPDGNNCKYVPGHGPILTASGDKIDCLDTLPTDAEFAKYQADQAGGDSDSSSDDESED